MPPIKYAIAFVIYNADRSRILIVQRPPNDTHLPNLWGLPAGTVKDNETFEDCVLRSGREKLGVQLKITKFIGRSNIERPDYILHMEEFETAIINGEPNVPQPLDSVTQYCQWQWGAATDLQNAANKGSLCSRIYLASLNPTA